MAVRGVGNSQFSQGLLDKVSVYATYPQKSVSLKQMVQFGPSPSAVTILRASQFIRQELPVRLAHRAVELANLPHGLSDMPSVQRVRDWYLKSFQDLTEFQGPEKFRIPATLYQDTQIGSDRGADEFRYYNPLEKVDDSFTNLPEVIAYNEQFVKCIENIKKRHDPTTTTIAEGVMELKSHWRRTNSPLHDGSSQQSSRLPIAIHSFLDRFYMSRIGIRMLIGQHVMISRASKDPNIVPEDYVGIICTKTRIGDIANEAIFHARSICQEYYGLYDSPPVKMFGDTDVEFMYVPSHLHHMLFELLKNSLRAVVETHGEDVDEYPEIRVIVAEGKEDIAIKISDEGGGIPRSGMPLIWTYMYTTAEKPLLEDHGDRHDFRAPMAGFGYGLPLSRLYARYFGGDLRLISMEGYGTDAYLHLSRLSDSEEPLV